MSTIKSRNFIRVVFLLTPLSPAISFAQSTAGFDNLNKLLISFADGVVRNTGYLMFTLAVVAFFWGIVQFIWAARQGAEGKGIQRGTQFIKWGLIAIFVMFSVWGIIKFAQDVFQIQGENTIIVPSLEFIRKGSTSPSSALDSFGSCNSNEVFNGTSCVTVGTITQAQATQLAQTCKQNGGSATACNNAVKAALSNATAGAVVNTQAKANALAQQCATAPGADPTLCQNAANAALANNVAAANNDECYYNATQKNFLDGQSCGSGSSAGTCSGGKCVSSATARANDECYYSINNANGYDGQSCGSGATGGKCSGGVCVPSDTYQSQSPGDRGGNDPATGATTGVDTSAYSCSAGYPCTPVGGGSGTCTPEGNFCNPDASSAPNSDAIWGPGTVNTGASNGVSYDFISGATGNPDTTVTSVDVTTQSASCNQDETTGSINCGN